MTTPENNDEIINLEATEITEPVPEVTVKTYKAPHRHRPDGSYDSRPNDPEYWKKYWHKKKLHQSVRTVVRYTSITTV